MGNCILKVYHQHFQPHEDDDDHHHHQMTTIKVVNPNGGIMELYHPIIADQITSEFPNHALFTTPNPTQHSPALLPKDRLDPGQLYYLLPLTKTVVTDSSVGAPYRMSFDHAARPPTVVNNYTGSSSSVWKVRLVIDPQHLSHILSQDATTEELIHSVRTVAKCATTPGVNTGGSGEYCNTASLHH